jgi:single-strand DNA-binding protein
MLPFINGVFGVVADPEPSFSEKGTAWLRLRVVAKDRVRDSNGNWSDGDPLWMNAVVFGKQAEHLTDSVRKGDTVMLTGRLKPNVWTDKEGVEHNDIQLVADECAVSMRWNPAKTPRYMEEGGAVAAVASSLGATEVQPTEAPF